MNKILHIDTSPRSSRSLTRQLTQAFITEWRSHHPHSELTYRDLNLQPATLLSEQWIAAAFTKANQRTDQMQNHLLESDTLLNELIAADIMVVGVPMYNFGVPASFKAWIDKVVRIERTFLFEPDDKQQPYKPRLKDKPVFL